LFQFVFQYYRFGLYKLNSVGLDKLKYRIEEVEAEVMSNFVFQYYISSRFVDVYQLDIHLFPIFLII